ncbi:hypothetical protein Esti_004953 [Eimeria stiedai]
MDMQLPRNLSRCFFTLSAPRLKGPATRRLQERRQRLLQQQAEQHTPHPRGAQQQQQQQQVLQQQQQQEKGPPKRVGAGFFANPMRAPEPVEGGNLAHDHFLELHKQQTKCRVVERLVALRRQRRQQQQQQQQQQEEKEAAAAEGGLSAALAGVYVHHEEALRQLAPRPHAFVEAQVKDLLAGASALANPLYPPSTPLAEDVEEEGGLPFQEGAPPLNGAPTEAQLRKIASCVHAPGLQLLHAETDALLSDLDASFEGGPPATKHEGGAPQTSLEEVIGGPPGCPLITSSRGGPPQPSESEQLLGLEPWEKAACGGPHEHAEEGAPSLVLAGGPLAKETTAKSGFLSGYPFIEDSEKGIYEADDVFPSPPSIQLGRRRGAPLETGAEGPPLSSAVAACLLRETRKAEAQAEAAREALLGHPQQQQEGDEEREGLVRATKQRGEREGGYNGDEVFEERNFKDAFLKSKEIQKNPQLAEIWKERGAIFADVRDACIPVSFERKGDILAGYAASRLDCCLFDNSFRRVWEVKGRDRLAFLDLVTSCDVQRQMKVGDVQPALLLDSKGLVLDDCFVAKAEKTVFLVTSGHASSHVFEYLAELANFCTKSGMNLSFQPSNKSTVLSLQGPTAMRRLVKQLKTCLVPELNSECFFANREMCASLQDLWGAPMTLEQMETLPYMSAWGLQMAGSGFVCSHFTTYSVCCMRIGTTGEDGVEFTVEASAAPLLARLLLDDCAHAAPTSSLKSVDSPPPSLRLGCFSALEMLRTEAGLPLMGLDLRCNHTAPQGGLARLVSFYKVRQKILLGFSALSKQLAVPPNVRRVAFLVGNARRIQRAEQIQRQLQQQRQQQMLQQRREEQHSQQQQQHEGQHQPQRHEQQQQQEEARYFAVAEGFGDTAEVGPPCFPLRGSLVLSHVQRRPIGVVTSVVWSPLLKCRVGQGLVLFEFARHREPVLFAVPQAVPLKTPKWKKIKILKGRRVRVLVQGRLHRLPLIPHRYSVNCSPLNTWEPLSQLASTRPVPFSALERPR